jgi:hypothetical protein
VIRIIKQRQDFHAIRFVDAIRRATGASLEEGLDHVRRLSEGEKISIAPVAGMSEAEFAGLLGSCGVEFSSSACLDSDLEGEGEGERRPGR